MKRALALSPLLLVTACAVEPAPVVAARPPDAPDVVVPGASPGRMRVMRVGHATVLLDFDGLAVLTDPWFSEKPGYHHGEPLGLALDALPRLDAVVVSHEHYDHFDVETFARYADHDVAFFVPRGLAAPLREAGFRNVQEMSPWDERRRGDLSVTAAPGEHSVTEVTWLLRARGFTVYFGGDTLLTPELVRDLPGRAGHVDLALPAVNGLRAFGHKQVMNSEDAARMVALLDASAAVPTHYAFQGSWFTDAFILGYDGTPARFVSAVKRVHPTTQVRVLPPGQWLTLRHAGT